MARSHGNRIKEMTGWLDEHNDAIAKTDKGVMENLVSVDEGEDFRWDMDRINREKTAKG